MDDKKELSEKIIRQIIVGMILSNESAVFCARFCSKWLGGLSALN